MDRDKGNVDETALRRATKRLMWRYHLLLFYFEFSGCGLRHWGITKGVVESLHKYICTYNDIVFY